MHPGARTSSATKAGFSLFPRSNEENAVLARAFDECREGQIPRPLGRNPAIMPRLLAAGYLTVIIRSYVLPIIQISLFRRIQVYFHIIGKMKNVKNARTKKKLHITLLEPNSYDDQRQLIHLHRFHSEM